MTMTDPIADMLTRIRNASGAYHETASMPYSKLKVRIADILKAEGYILGWTEEEAEVGKNLILELKYSDSRERAISGIRRISKPGLRVYAKSSAWRDSVRCGTRLDEEKADESLTKAQASRRATTSPQCN